MHDFLVIIMDNEKGRKYVLDCTGFQFGIPEWLYTYEEYCKNFVDKTGHHFMRDIMEMLEKYRKSRAEGEKAEREYVDSLFSLRDKLLNTPVEDLREAFKGSEL